MKNLLARGGVEFLAVLLGISASLWIDSNNKEAELVSQRQDTYQLLENQMEELLNYSNSKLNHYELQVKRSGLIIDQWETIQFDTIKNKDLYISDIWSSIKNAFYPDFTTYETLMNNGQINLVDFETIKYFGRLYKYMDDINGVQKKERGWRDFLENHFMTKYAASFKKYEILNNLFELFDLTKNDPIVFAHLKMVVSIHGERKRRVENFKNKLIEIQNHLAEVKNDK